MVDFTQLHRATSHTNRVELEFHHASNGGIGFRSIKLIAGLRTEEVAKDAGFGIDVRVDEVSHECKVRGLAR